LFGVGREEAARILHSVVTVFLAKRSKFFAEGDLSNRMDGNANATTSAPRHPAPTKANHPKNNNHGLN
jgi:hypothetical protein